MLRVAKWLLLSSVLVWSSPSFGVPPATEPTTASTKHTRNNGSTPEAKHDDGRFLKMHESFLSRAKEGAVDLLFLGDSITELWSTRGKDVWKTYYDAFHPANFGIGGDLTQNVLWRVQNGELDQVAPKVIVLLIGTNNTSSNTSDEISAAIEKLVQLVRQKLPQTKVLLLSIFPRGPHTDGKGKFDDGQARMQIIRAVNARIAALDDGKSVRVFDLTDVFVVYGKIPDDVMPDQLHPNAKGYEMWARAMQPLLQQMMQQ